MNTTTKTNEEGQRQVRQLLGGLPGSYLELGMVPNACGPVALLIHRWLRKGGARVAIRHLGGWPPISEGSPCQLDEEVREQIAEAGSGHFVVIAECPAEGLLAIDGASGQFSGVTQLLVYPAGQLGQQGSAPLIACWDEENWETEFNRRVGLKTLAYLPPAGALERYHQLRKELEGRARAGGDPRRKT